VHVIAHDADWRMTVGPNQALLVCVNLDIVRNCGSDNAGADPGQQQQKTKRFPHSRFSILLSPRFPRGRRSIRSTRTTLNGSEGRPPVAKDGIRSDLHERAAICRRCNRAVEEIFRQQKSAH
jgi:hypothetical protein